MKRFKADDTRRVKEAGAGHAGQVTNVTSRFPPVNPALETAGPVLQ